MPMRTAVARGGKIFPFHCDRWVRVRLYAASGSEVRTWQLECIGLGYDDILYLYTTSTKGFMQKRYHMDLCTYQSLIERLYALVAPSRIPIQVKIGSKLVPMDPNYWRQHKIPVRERGISDVCEVCR